MPLAARYMVTFVTNWGDWSLLQDGATLPGPWLFVKWVPQHHSKPPARRAFGPFATPTDPQNQYENRSRIDTPGPSH